jgi:hypothetical protein
MTTDSERWQSISGARWLLDRLASGPAMTITEMRKLCHAALRHYPSEYDVEHWQIAVDMRKKFLANLGEIATRIAGEPKP